MKDRGDACVLHVILTHKRRQDSSMESCNGATLVEDGMIPYDGLWGLLVDGQEIHYFGREGIAFCTHTPTTSNVLDLTFSLKNIKIKNSV